MSNDSFLETVFETHYHMTVSDEGFIHQMNTKNFLMPSDQSEFEDLVDRAFEKFETLPQSNIRGSVHLHPDTWTGIFCQTVIDARDEEPDIDLIELPNGCCSNSNCQINIFYQCCVDVNPKPTSPESKPIETDV